MVQRQLSWIPRATFSQIEFAAQLRLDVSSDTVTVAISKIEDAIDLHFWGRSLGRPTEKQIKLAEKFGFDIAGATRRVAEAVIDDIMTQLNLESIESQKLRPGVKAMRVHDPLSTTLTISSIKEDGTVYFKASGCIRAWARNVRRVIVETG